VDFATLVKNKKIILSRVYKENKIFIKKARSRKKSNKNYPHSHEMVIFVHC